MARCMLGSARCSSETDRVGGIHSNHARGVQYWHSTRLGAADREEQGIGVHRHGIAPCWQAYFCCVPASGEGFIRCGLAPYGNFLQVRHPEEGG